MTSAIVSHVVWGRSLSRPVRERSENGKRKVFYSKTQKEVQEKMKVLLREQQQGLLITKPNETVEQFLTQWVEDRKPSVRIRTYERYEAFMRLHVVPVIGRVKMQQLNP